MRRRGRTGRVGEELRRTWKERIQCKMRSESETSERGRGGGE